MIHFPRHFSNPPRLHGYICVTISNGRFFYLFIHSVLMEARDNANNSRIARRFVIFDQASAIILNTENSGKLYVSSANADTDYKWQTTVDSELKLCFQVST